jgi:hypothetical protein
MWFITDFGPVLIIILHFELNFECEGAVYSSTSERLYCN